MLAHSRKPKISSEARKLIEKADPESGYAWLRLSGTPLELIDEAMLAETYITRQRLLTDIANLPDETSIERFRKRWEGRINAEQLDGLLTLRDQLRAVWNRPDSLSSQKVLDQWLCWIPSEIRLKPGKDISIRTASRSSQTRCLIPFRCSVRAGKLVPDFSSLRALLIQGVFEHWPYFRFCSNPDCLVPYFIAKRRDQVICDATICKAEKQREHARNWWRNKHADQSSSKTKGTVKNGARETR